MALSNHRMAWACSACLLLLGSLPARAEPATSFSIATGQLGMRKEVPHALAIELEIRPPWRWNLVRPVAGLLTSSTGGAYVYSGFVIEVPLPGGLQLSPGFAPGVVLANGGRDLGSPLEFRSSLEVSFAPMEALRIGVGFSHISNAGLTSHNPGVEVLVLSIAFPARN